VKREGQESRGQGGRKGADEKFISTTNIRGIHKPMNRKPASKQPKYVLRLYVTGMTERSRLAIRNIKQICEEHLAGRYDLEVIDIYRQPYLAEGDQIIAAPTMIKKLPLPIRKFIGDMSATEKILLGLDLRPEKKTRGKLSKKSDKAASNEKK
jgi:circadian clock protein KaiB